MFRRKDPLYRTFAATLSALFFMTSVLPVGGLLVAQPANVPNLNPQTFQATDLDPTFASARQSQSETDFESIINNGRIIATASWEAAYDAQIAASVAAVTESDNFNTVAEYRDYVQKSLEIQKQQALSAWEIAADVAIETERLAFVTGLTDTQRTNTINQGDSEMAKGEQALRNLDDEAAARLADDRAG